MTIAPLRNINRPPERKRNRNADYYPQENAYHDVCHDSFVTHLGVPCVCFLIFSGGADRKRLLVESARATLLESCAPRVYGIPDTWDYGLCGSGSRAHVCCDWLACAVSIRQRRLAHASAS